MIEPCSTQCSFCFLQFADVMTREHLFSGIQKEEIEEIISSVHHQVRTYAQGDVIIHEDEEYKNLIFILQGKVSTQIMNADGQVLVVEQLQAPATLAPAALFSSDARIPVTIVVEEDT
jgi:CRP/FNR family transcriptional regulator, dissimilatory nitrate respiration regulator